MVNGLEKSDFVNSILIAREKLEEVHGAYLNAAAIADETSNYYDRDRLEAQAENFKILQKGLDDLVEFQNKYGRG